MRVVNKQQSEGEEVKKHIGKMERDVREEGLNHIGYNISFGLHFHDSDLHREF